jgi:hypothetical protein
MNGQSMSSSVGTNGCPKSPKLLMSLDDVSVKVVSPASRRHGAMAR